MALDPEKGVSISGQLEDLAREDSIGYSGRSQTNW